MSVRAFFVVAFLRLLGVCGALRACQASLKSGAFGQNTRHDLHPSGGNRGFVENLLRTNGSVPLSSPLDVLSRFTLELLNIYVYFWIFSTISPSLTSSGLSFNLQSWVGAVKAVVNVGVKPLLNAPVNAGRIVNAEVTFYCPVFFESQAVSNWSQFAHKISATRYYRTAKAWVANPFPVYPRFS